MKATTKPNNGELMGQMRACIVHPDIGRNQNRRAPEFSLAEAESLSRALGLDVVDGRVVRLPKAHAGLLFGKGKIAELGSYIKANDIGLVLVDGPVTPIQQRNLEKEWDVRVLDRTGLILEIFGDRAQTREGVLQVDLAALEYQKSRLVRSWTHLERQRGGLSFIGGSGESQLESDRRMIDEAIIRLKRQLAKVAKTRALHRAARKKVPFPIVALVGYTNAGKSTVFNHLTGASVLAKDMLFATLDPTMRAIELPNGREIILSDTVGFISDLPTQLVAAFRATLEEVLDADLVLHVRDIAHPQTEEQAEDVREILTELGISEAAQENLIEVWNKIDCLETEEREAVVTAAARDPKAVAISAVTEDGIDGLLEAIDTALAEVTNVENIQLMFKDGAKRAWLFEQGVVSNETQTDEGFDMTVDWTSRQASKFATL